MSYNSSLSGTGDRRAIYALCAALGFTLLWQAAGVINFAQGEFVMLPAFSMLFFIAVRRAAVARVPADVRAVAMLILGLRLQARDRRSADQARRDSAGHRDAGPVDRGQVDRARRATAPRRIRSRARSRRASSRSAASTSRMRTSARWCIAGLIVIGLQSVPEQDRHRPRDAGGRAEHRGARRCSGINVKRMVLYVFLINAVLAVVAALLVTPTYLAKFDMGDSIGQKAFFAAIIGGFNQTRGALLGGVLIGILENVVGFYVSPAYKEGVALVLFLGVILFRPEGLLGKSEERKV